MSKSKFLGEFLRRPLEVGAVLPSSRFLAEQMFADVDSRQVHTFLEYGPGLGSFTAYAQATLTSGTRLVLIEVNPRFREVLRTAFPQAEIFETPEGLDRETGARVDLVASGLPFTFIPEAVTKQTIEQTFRLLRPGGTFRTFIYHHSLWLPKNRRLLASLRSTFAEVQLRHVMLNIPPAVVIQCTKARE